ncbi:MAG: ABC transporter transmembrane domain-containing protein [Mycobacteriales bacterium]
MHDLRRLLALARPQRADFLKASGAGLLVSALYLAAALLVARALGRLLSGAGLAEVGWLLAAALGVAALRAVAIFIADAASAAAAAEVKSALRERLTAKVLDLGPGWLTATRSGWVQSMLVDGVERLERMYSRLLTQTPVSFSVGLVTCLVVLVIDPVVGVVVLVCLFAMPAAVIASRYAMRHTGNFWWNTYREMYAEYLEALQGMPTLNVLGASHRHGRELGARADGLRDRAIDLSYKEIKFSLVINAAVGTATALAVGIGALRVASGALSGTALLVILLLVRECFRPVNQLLAGFHAAYYGLIAAKPMFGLLDESPFVPDTVPAPSPLRRPPSLAFDHVTFAYSGRVEPALRGLDVRVHAGAAVALVGSSGAGNPPRRPCCCASGTSPKAGSLWTAGTSGIFRSPSCAARSPWSPRTPTCCTAASATTCGWPVRMPATENCERRWTWRPRRTSSRPCRTGWTPWWGNAASGCPAASGSGSRSPVRCSRTRRC